jgi:hypothetical protein
MTLLILALLAGARDPSIERQRLGRQLAEHGTLASLLPLMKVKETEELIAEDSKLTPTDQVKLRATADRVFKAGYERLMNATGDAYARQLSLADLKALTSFYSSPVASRYQSIMPNVIVATMQSVGQMDFKKDVRTAFCAETQRLCSQ